MSDALPSATRAPLVRAIALKLTLPFGNTQLHILNGVSFDVYRGEWIILMGPSGSGKSTLLGLVAGLDTPTAGQLLLDGVDITRLDERHLARIRNQKIGVVFQSFNLLPGLTAQENVEMPLYVRFGRRHARNRAREMLHLVGLDQRRDHRPHQLSGGQQQRVAIARALVTEPTLLVADEPTGNLDSVTSTQILNLFAQLRAQLGITLIVATHDMQVAVHADRVFTLHDGRLVSLDHASASAISCG
jgi:putative ABC transport system ATP-binding protein